MSLAASQSPRSGPSSRFRVSRRRTAAAGQRPPASRRASRAILGPALSVDIGSFHARSRAPIRMKSVQIFGRAIAGFASVAMVASLTGAVRGHAKGRGTARVVRRREGPTVCGWYRTPEALVRGEYFPSFQFGCNWLMMFLRPQAVAKLGDKH